MYFDVHIYTLGIRIAESSASVCSILLHLIVSKAIAPADTSPAVYESFSAPHSHQYVNIVCLQSQSFWWVCGGTPGKVFSLL